MMLIHRGKFTLKRENSTHHAGFCMLQASPEQLTGKLMLLHPEEKAYYDSLKSDKRRESYLLGRVCAKKAIGALSAFEDLGRISIDAGVFQFPVVKYSVTPNLQVCISHCEHLGIAISYPEGHPMGVDVEETDKNNIEAILGQLTPGEQALAGSVPLPEEVACTMMWTMKEALSKILRTGLTIDLKLLEIDSLANGNGVCISRFKNLIQYKAVSCVAGPYVCSVVMPARTTADLEAFWRSFQECAGQYIF